MSLLTTFPGRMPKWGLFRLTGGRSLPSTKPRTTCLFWRRKTETRCLCVNTHKPAYLRQAGYYCSKPQAQQGHSQCRWGRGTSSVSKLLLGNKHSQGAWKMTTKRPLLRFELMQQVRASFRKPLGPCSFSLNENRHLHLCNIQWVCFKCIILYGMLFKTKF